MWQEPPRRLRELRGVGEETERGEPAAAAAAATTTATAAAGGGDGAGAERRRRHVPDLP